MAKNSRRPAGSRLLAGLHQRFAKEALSHPAPEDILNSLRQDVHFGLLALQAQADGSDMRDIDEHTWAKIAKVANMVQLATDYQADVYDDAECRILETGCRWMQDIANRAHAGHGWHATTRELAGVTRLVVLISDTLDRFTIYALTCGWESMNIIIQRTRAQNGGLARCVVVDRA